MNVSVGTSVYMTKAPMTKFTYKFEIKISFKSVESVYRPDNYLN